MKVIIDLPIQSLVLDVSPALLNALNRAMIVSKNYEQGMHYVKEEGLCLTMDFVDDMEFEKALLEKKALLKEASNG